MRPSLLEILIGLIILVVFLAVITAAAGSQPVAPAGGAHSMLVNWTSGVV